MNLAYDFEDPQLLLGLRRSSPDGLPSFSTTRVLLFGDDGSAGELALDEGLGRATVDLCLGGETFVRVPLDEDGYFAFTVNALDGGRVEVQGRIGADEALDVEIVRWRVSPAGRAYEGVRFLSGREAAAAGTRAAR